MKKQAILIKKQQQESCISEFNNFVQKPIFMKKHLIVLVVCLMGSSLYAQICFEKIITLSDASTQSQGNAVTQTSDQGFAIAAADNAGGDHGVLIRTNAYGDTAWTKNFSGRFFGIRETPDGGFILTGTINGSLLMLKTSPEGETQWENTAGADAVGFSVCVTNDGGYCFAGVADYAQNKISKMLLVRTDADGTVLWSQEYGNRTNYYLGKSMFQCADGGFIICGYDQTTPFGGESSLCLVKTKSGGSLEWRRSYHKSFTETGWVVMPSGETGFLAVGTTNAPSFLNFYLVKTDLLGDTIWTKTIAVRQLGSALSATTVAQGGYLLTATVNDAVSNSNNIQLIRINDNGDTLWTRQVGSMDHEYVFSTEQTSDQGFIICGSIYKSSTQIMRTYLVKTDSLGYYPLVSVPGMEAETGLLVFPNPTSDIISVVVPENTLTIELCNMQGCIIDKISVADEHARKLQLKLSGYSPGIYLVKVVTTENLFTRKILKL